MSKRTSPPFRADHVGSLLRPAALKQARERFAKGEIAAADLKAIEDREIERVIKRQEDVGLQSIDHRTRLRAGAAVRLLDLDALAGFLLVGRRERLIEIDIQFTRGIIRNIEQRDVGRIGRARPQQRCNKKCNTTNHFDLH